MNTEPNPSKEQPKATSVATDSSFLQDTLYKNLLTRCESLEQAEKKLLTIQRLFTIYYAAKNKTHDLVSQEFFFLVGAILRGEPLDKLEIRLFEKSEVVEQITDALIEAGHDS